MSKSSSTPTAGSKPKEQTSSAAQKSARGPQHDTSRETLESIAFAFVLALLFRTFVAEAFVIPTGSMAPTLFGRNKDVVCTACHHKYEVGASDELDDDGYLVRRIENSVCPNCRYQNKIRDLPVFKGDRILVNKFPYQIGEPERWDVIVFRYPEDPQKNYIKRLIGLPGESIRISRGDVYARLDDQGEFQILRKQNPNKQKVLQQLVYDDRHPPVDLLKSGWPERWNPMARKGDESRLNGWVPDEDNWRRDTATRSYTIVPDDSTKWLRYQHLVPNDTDWDATVDRNGGPKDARPQLITDFCGYNSYTGGRGPNVDDDRFWVGDLTLNCTIEITDVKGPESEVLFELVEGVRRYRCQIDVTSGQATLYRNDELADDANAVDIKLASAQTPIRGLGKYTVAFANVDDRLCLWVNSSWFHDGLISFGAGAELTAPANRNPQEADLVPAGIAVRGLGARVGDLLLQRDIYYRAESVPNNDYDGHDQELLESIRIRDSLSNPADYGDFYNRNAREITFRALRADEFFVMGDNSPRSQDSRLWPNRRHAYNRHAVPRQALLGKAFFIYWPHGVPFLNHGKGFAVLNHSVARNIRGEPVVDTYPEYELPFYPQWWRWKRIR
jgi:signal peptidase I